MSEIAEEMIQEQVKLVDELLWLEIAKQRRYGNRNNAAGWSMCDREIKRLVDLIPDPVLDLPPVE